MVAATRTGSVLVSVVGTTDSMGDTTDNGAVSVLDASRGAVRRTIATGIFPIAVAVDNRTNRVFVVNYTARWSDGGPITPTAPKEWWAPLQRWLAGRLAVVPSPRQPASLTHGSVTVLDGSRL
jgi:hypothetical protein